MPESPEKVVVIGASAGGLEALKKLLPHLPDGDKVAYILAQHLDPDHRSLLDRLLSSTTQMPVKEAEDNEPLKGGRILVVPPGYHATVRRQRLCLEPSGDRPGPKPAIDHLLTSASEDCGENTVAVILSGSGRDGAAGTRAVRARGGITLAQDPKEAQFASMPETAASTGCVDRVGSVEDLASELHSLIRTPGPGGLRERELSEDSSASPIREIVEVVRKHTGCDFSEYKPTTLGRRVARRMAVTRNASMNDYLALLKGPNGGNEAEELYRDMLVSVTSFFRDPEAFEALENAITEKLERDQSGRFRAWIPGSATGEEAYSVAIILRRVARRLGWLGSIQIFATDIDEAALRVARRGVYPATSLETVDRETLDSHFAKVQDGYEVSEFTRDGMIFARQNLVADPPFSRVDLISCRNVLIYFRSRLQEATLRLFHQALNEDGLLLLGSSESTLVTDSLFRVRDAHAKLFERTHTHSPRQPVAFPPPGPTAPQRQAGSAPEAPPRPDLRREIEEALTRRLVPCAIATNSQQQTVYIVGDLRPYARLSDGELTRVAPRLVRPELAAPLKSVLYRVRRTDEIQRSPPIELEPEGERLLLEAFPFESKARQERLVIVVFHRLVQHQSPEDGSGDTTPINDQIEDELTATRVELQTVMEEYETASEQLQSANEELQAANEELQSTNEELETSNEELQATNEEMRSVNDELQSKSEELAHANADLRNLLDAAGLALVIVDENLRIARHTPAAADVFHISPLDDNVRLTHVATRFEIPELGARLNAAVNDQRDSTLTVGDDQHTYRIRISPYRSHEGNHGGAVIAIIDQSAEAQTRREERDQAQQGASGVAVVDSRQRVVKFNETASALLGYTEDEIVGQSVDILLFEDDEARRRASEAGDVSEISGPGGQLVARHKDGSPVPLDVAVTRLGAGQDYSHVFVMSPGGNAANAGDESSREESQMEASDSGSGG